MTSWSTLTDEVRDEVAAELQGALVDLIDLSLLAKQAHWTVVGDNFRSFHLQLDELVTAYRLWTDQVAERMVTVGALPDGQSRTVAAMSELPELDKGWIDATKLVATVADRVEAAARRARGHMEALGELDAVSEDLLIAIVTGLEEQLWMLRAQVR
jgi:starvation-inducible DNA-binding protein